MVQDLLQRAINAFKAERKDEARTLFMDVVEQDQHNEQAWLYLSTLVDTLEEQQICLENVLTVNPNHKKAKEGLATIQAKLAAQGGSTSSPAEPPPAPPSSFGGSSAPIGAEFADVSGDSVFGNASASSASAFDGGFGSDFNFGDDSGGFEANDSDVVAFDVSAADTNVINDDPFSWMADTGAASPEPAQPPEAIGGPSTSVDWGNDDQPAVYGSGRQVEEPDYDSWMENLPIGNSSPPAATPPGSAFGDEADASPFGDSFNDSTPFGDASYMVDDEAVEADSPFAEFASDDQYGDNPWDTPEVAQPGSRTAFGSESVSAFDDDQFGAEASSLETAGAFDSDAALVDDLESVESSPFGTFDFGDETADSGFEFSFDDESGSEPGAKTAASVLPATEYYKHIPREIEPLAGGITRRSVLLMGGIVIMLALNVASVLMLVM